MSTDRNLLFGLIAMQNGLITRENLMTATGLWLQDKSQPMDELLLSQEFISEQQHRLLAELVNMHLDKHDGDAERSLAAVDAISSVRDELRELGDEELEHTLGHISQARDLESGDHTMLWTPPEPGQRFRILRPHAKGGLGIVNVAHDAELNREVALKEIRPEHADNPDSRSRFVQEAEITGGLEHPGIVPVYGLGTYDDNRPYYAMRLIRGDTLKDSIDRYHQEGQGARDVGSRRLEMRRLLAHFISLCNAIEYAHSRGILHRDIKPANVMLGKYGETLVVDWGLAKPIDRKEEYRRQEEQTLHPVTSGSSSATQMGRAIGTPSYMSPEQAAGRLDRLDATSDVYSLGATLYYLMAGKPPLGDADVRSAIRKAQTGDFQPPRSIQIDMPRSLESICLKAMALKPEDRYQSAAELSADVERLLGDEPVTAHSESWGERVTRLARRHRTWFRAGAAALLLITIGSVVATMLVNAARDDVVKQLRRREQLLLAAQASTLREDKPQRALLLARESIKLARMKGDPPAQLAFEVLQATLAVSSGELFARVAGQTFLSKDGRWLATGGRRTLEQLWRIESGMSTPSQRIQLGDLPRSTDVEWSLDGRWLAFGDDGGQIYLYDLTSPDPVGSSRKWSAHGGPVSELEFTPDGGRIISTSTSEAVCKLWNLLQVEPDRDAIIIPTSFDSAHIAVSPDGGSLAISGTGPTTLFVWDISADKTPRKKLALNLIVRNQSRAVFSPDGHFLAAADSENAIRLWNIEAETPEASTTVGHHREGITGLMFTNKGQNLISSSYDETVRVLGVKARDCNVVLRGHPSGIFEIALSHSGRFLATGSSDGMIRLWDLQEVDPNDHVRVMLGHEAQVFSLAFSPEDDILYSASGDGTVRTWRLQASQMLAAARMIRVTEPRRFGGGINTTSHQTNGYLVAQLPGGEWRRWNIDEGDLEGETLGIPKERDLILPIASNDGRWLLANTYLRIPTLIDLKVGSETPRLLELNRHEEGNVVGALIDPKSRFAITYGSDGRIERWDLTKRDPSAAHELIGQVPSEISEATVSSDGRWLFAGSVDGTIRRWNLDADDVAGSEEPLRAHQRRVVKLAVSPDGRLLASIGRDRTLRLWQREASSRDAEIMTTVPVKILSSTLSFSPDNTLLFSPDSRYLVASEAGDTGQIHMWDTTAKDVASSRRSLPGHSSTVYGITFSADSQALASGERKGSILIWDMGEDEPEVTWRLSGHSAPVFALRFFDKNRRLISASLDNTARIWELDEARLLKLARDVAGRELTDPECEQYGLKPASNDGPF